MVMKMFLVLAAVLGTCVTGQNVGIVTGDWLITGFKTESETANFATEGNSAVISRKLCSELDLPSSSCTAKLDYSGTRAMYYYAVKVTAGSGKDAETVASLIQGVSDSYLTNALRSLDASFRRLYVETTRSPTIDHATLLSELAASKLPQNNAGSIACWVIWAVLTFCLLCPCMLQCCAGEFNLTLRKVFAFIGIVNSFGDVAQCVQLGVNGNPYWDDDLGRPTAFRVMIWIYFSLLIISIPVSWVSAGTGDGVIIPFTSTSSFVQLFGHSLGKEGNDGDFWEAITFPCFFCFLLVDGPKDSGERVFSRTSLVIFYVMVIFHSVYVAATFWDCLEEVYPSGDAPTQLILTVWGYYCFFNLVCKLSYVSNLVISLMLFPFAFPWMLCCRCPNLEFGLKKMSEQFV